MSALTTITSHKDVDNLTMTFVAEFPAPAARLWQVWQDPRQLERWWGPPTWPATFDRHDFAVGGESRYYMTGPDGTKAHGWWRITALDEPRRLEFEDGFGDQHGEPTDKLGITQVAVTFEDTGAGTRMTTVSHFTDAEHLERLAKMGMEEGMRLAMGQIDEILGTA
ncbi:SRPBCC family protein [Actinoplanes sp. RD1]|uniref:SRPBCC family protein n=1 Tax=Actinoplanes sp. RD1 TaxID=3064538 RepID=UPI003557B90B